MGSSSNTYWINRLIQAVILWFGASLIVFSVVRLAPGDPSAMLADPAFLSEEQMLQIREQLGLEEPLHIQYVKSMLGMARGKLRSYITFDSTIAMIKDAFPVTMLVVFTGFVMTLVLSLPLGVAAGRRPGSALDRFLSGAIVTTISFPNFVFGLLLILVVSEELRLLPVTGIRPPGTEGYNPLLIWPYVILPGMMTGFSLTPIIARYVRDSVQDTLNEDFVRTAYAKGLPEFTVMRRHVLRNALVPVVTVVGTVLPLAMGGSVITESVFGLPGLGKLTVQAALERDYPVVMTNTLFVAILVIAGNLVVDWLYGVVDPRIRLR